MFRHLPALPLALMGLAGLAACSGGATAPAPVTTAAAPLPAPSLTVPLGGVAARGDTLTSALGVYTLTIDPGSLTATAEVRQLRTSQANDDLYLLPIDSFLRPDSFRVTSVKGTSETLEIGYAIRHPFLAPSDPAGTPNGSSNRADLGITGM
ncbi:MAG TPA: hypothetical protein VEI97_01950, partial [bacterium]|nr:hypothetical protein [bacterium]